jgi:eukaryotic-like serine/threonine-protein kinase
MTPEEWSRVRPILESALEVEPDNRADFLNEACADAALRREVESLIMAHEQAGTDVLSTNSPAFHPGDEAKFRLEPGKSIGVYEILEEIGVGGMGAVYRAIRADGQYQQQVALKIVRSELGAEFTTNRFRNERQILASLNHPNIARILDGGATAEGLPYFVMELVEGQRIDEYCQTHKLSVSERLNLFLQICSAVGYAHQHLIIHRDIKPGNILVTTEGVPKLLDFGIAKILESSDPAIQPQQTISLVRLLTPEYASPEQVKGESITTASDVYSLGVVLYELLTGRTPYSGPTHTPHELFRAVCETEPEKPSTAVRRQATPGHREPRDSTPEETSAGVREFSAEKLSKILRGDLDNIVLMALRKEPARRYASVDQFAQDLQRHLQHLPVSARKDTAAYRSSKFIRRHKAGVAAATAFTLILLATLGLTFRQARIAQRRFNDVRQLANSLIFDIHDSIQDLPGSTPARKLIVDRALQYLNSLSHEASGDRSLQRDLATAYERVGDVQGNPYFANVGDGNGALQSYEIALSTRLGLLHSDPTNLALQRELLINYTKIAAIDTVRANWSGVEETYRKSLAIAESISAVTKSADDQDNLALAHGNLGFPLAVRGDLSGARREYSQALAIWQELNIRDPHNVKLRARNAGISERLSEVLAVSGDTIQALSLTNKAVEIRKEICREDPTNAARRQQLAVSYEELGMTLEYVGSFSSALENFQKALTISQLLSSADPANVQARRILGNSYNNAGRTLSKSGKPTEGLSNHQKALEIFTSLSKLDPTDMNFVTGIADCYSGLGLAHMTLAGVAGLGSRPKASHLQEARFWYQRSLEEFRGAGNFESGIQQLGSETPAQIEQNIKRCDKAIVELQNSGTSMKHKR